MVYRAILQTTFRFADPFVRRNGWLQRYRVRLWSDRKREDVLDDGTLLHAQFIAPYCSNLSSHLVGCRHRR